MVSPAPWLTVSSSSHETSCSLGSIKRLPPAWSLAIPVAASNCPIGEDPSQDVVGRHKHPQDLGRSYAHASGRQVMSPALRNGRAGGGPHNTSHKPKSMYS